MNETNDSIETKGETVEEAIANGLSRLGLPEDAVEIEILDDGSKGIFGLGAKEAVVRLTIRIDPDPEYEIEVATGEPMEIDETPAVEPIRPADEFADDFPGFDEPDDISIARATVEELLEKMNVRAKVHAGYSEIDSRSKQPGILVDISGDDLSILIGKKAETLNALQYVTRLIVGKELNRSVNLLVDVQGYRSRKEKRIRRIAQTMAKQAVDTGKRQVLEPMNPYDRRLVHIELEDNTAVYTESIGEGTRRKVTIIPKEG